MKGHENTTDYIEAYLNDLLSQEERAAFERRINTDAAFADEVALQRETRDLLEVYSQVDYKTKLKAIDEKMVAEKSAKVIPFGQYRKIWSVAAVILALIASVYIFQAVNSPNFVSVDDYFSPYQDRITLKGSADLDTNLQEAMNAYNQKSWSMALPLFEKILKAQPDHIDAQFYYGISLLGNGEAEKSIKQLLPVSKSLKYGSPGSWYLALAYLKAGKGDLAKPLLSKMAQNEGSPYQKNSMALLDSL